jgi:hypothetical protein
VGTTEYLGACHCGALLVSYHTALPPSAWPMRACQCSFCRRHGALSTSDPAGLIAYKCSDPLLLQRYRFGNHCTDFLICRACGVYVGAQMSSEGERFGILNTPTLLRIPPDLPPAASMKYDDESPETRHRRRRARWTPVAADSL